MQAFSETWILDVVIRAVSPGLHLGHVGDKEFTSGNIPQGTFQGGEHMCLFIMSSTTSQRSEKYLILSCFRPSKWEEADYYSSELIQWRLLQSTRPKRDSIRFQVILNNEAWRKIYLPHTFLRASEEQLESGALSGLAVNQTEIPLNWLD